jgi:preprotein translocase subunit YajC
MRSVASTMRQEKQKTTSLTWNMHPGDLVRVHDGLLGYIIKIDSSDALRLNDWRQEATVMTSRGKIGVHPKTLQVVQKV